MKKDKEPYARCPYCSNHCLLTDPKCHKGKELASTLKTVEKVKLENKSASPEGSILGIDEKLLKLLCTLSVEVCDKNSYQILRTLLRNGSMQEEALYKGLNMKSCKFNKLAHKLSKKELIHRLPVDQSKDYQIVLSNKGIKKAKKIDLKYTEQVSKCFEPLDKLQKQQLETLLSSIVMYDENDKTTNHIKC